MIKENRKFMRPNEIIKICSDNSKAKKEFNWKPRHSLETIALKLLKGELL